MHSAKYCCSWRERIDQSWLNSSVKRMSARGLSSWYVGLMLITSERGSKRSESRRFLNFCYFLANSASDVLILCSWLPGAGRSDRLSLSTKMLGQERRWSFAECGNFSSCALDLKLIMVKSSS